jgi:acyl-CoA reductase-like NAD-dependent aldehyde dehydrogenase
VFNDLQTRMPVFRDEIFGPVLEVCEFFSLDEALELANNSMFLDQKSALARFL